MKKSHTKLKLQPLATILFLLIAQCLIAQSSANKTVRQFFPRTGTYEYQLLKALDFNPNPSLTNINLNETVKSYSQLTPLEKAFGELGIIAAEIYYKDLPNTTAESALKDIANRTIPEIRKQVVGYLGALVISAISQPGNNEVLIALKTWATDQYRSFKIRTAKGVLDEYNKWKLDPCGYKADGYKAPPDCALKGLNFTQWYSTHKPPEDILGKAGLKSAVSNNADAMVSGIAVGLTGITLGASAAAVASGLGIVVGVTVPGGLSVATSLVAAFGGVSVTATTAAPGATAAIGATAWGGVVAAPIAATILVIVVGTVEGIRVVEAEKVGPMLKMKLGAAMTSPINIANEINSQEGTNMFYMAFIESSLKGFQYTEPKVDGEVRFYCQAGYVSQFKLSYTLKAASPFEQDKSVNQTTNSLSVGQEQTFTIPYNAINIKVKGLYAVGDWKEIFDKTLTQPTYVCYTSYGTVFAPDYKTDCPEIGSMVTKTNELTITHGGGYSAWVNLTYTQNGKAVVAQDQKGYTLGWRKVYTIPADAKNITLLIKEATGLAWEPWKTVINNTWPLPPSGCIKIYGTTLNPKWNNECK